MSTSKRKTRKKTTKAKSSKSKVELIDFDTWFFFAVKDGQVRDTQKAEIAVFFKGKGLKYKEEKSRFDDTLKLY